MERGGTGSTAYTVTLTQGVQTNESSSANLQVPTPIGTFGFSGANRSQHLSAHRARALTHFKKAGRNPPSLCPLTKG